MFLVETHNVVRKDIRPEQLLEKLFESIDDALEDAILNADSDVEVRGHVDDYIIIFTTFNDSAFPKVHVKGCAVMGEYGVRDVEVRIST